MEPKNFKKESIKKQTNYQIDTFTKIVYNKVKIKKEGKMGTQKDKKMNIHIPDYALGIMKKMWDADEEIYIVGGSLRDALLGLTAHDYDMATSAHPERTEEILSHLRVIETGLKHGTVTVIAEGHPIEITTFRVDGEYTDSRRPDRVSFTRSIGEDLARRDFTVNAMAYSPRESLIDLFGGREDLAKKIIRAVGDPHTRFEEDALRIMRAFRFSAQLGFEIEENTLRAAFDLRERLANISRERIGAEFIRLICSKFPEKPLSQMNSLEIMPFVLGFCPDEKLFSLLSRMPSDDVARLGFLLCGADEDSARAGLNLLKCSNKQKTGALAVARGVLMPVRTQKDATLLRASVGEYDVMAVKASVLLGISDESAIALVEQNTAPSRISELAIGGRELGELGFCGKEIGEMLEYLLCAVIDEPTLNTREALIALAKKKQKEKGE